MGIIILLNELYDLYKTIKTDDIYNKTNLEVNDERNLLIDYKAIAAAGIIGIFTCLFAVFIALAEKNDLAFLLCMIIFFIFLLSYIIFRWYYNKKY